MVAAGFEYCRRDTSATDLALRLPNETVSGAVRSRLSAGLVNLAVNVGQFGEFGQVLDWFGVLTSPGIRAADASLVEMRSRLAP